MTIASSATRARDGDRRRRSTQIVVRAAEAVGGRARAPAARHARGRDRRRRARGSSSSSPSPYGRVLPDVARDVQERVAAALGTMCGVNVTAVDVTIEELVDDAGGRREARRSALTLLYQWDVTEQAPGELYEGEIGEYARDVTAAVVRDVAELDAPDHRGGRGVRLDGRPARRDRAEHPPHRDPRARRRRDPGRAR